MDDYKNMGGGLNDDLKSGFDPISEESHSEVNKSSSTFDTEISDSEQEGRKNSVEESTEKRESCDTTESVNSEESFTEEITQNEKNMGQLCHILSFAGLLLPFANIWAPLILWLVEKDKSDFVDQCGKESINCQISYTIYSFSLFFVTTFFTLILSFIPVLGQLMILLGFFVVVPLGLIVFVLMIIPIIKAIVAAGKGEIYKYPFIIRLLK